MVDVEKARITLIGKVVESDMGLDIYKLKCRITPVLIQVVMSLSI